MFDGLFFGFYNFCSSLSSGFRFNDKEKYFIFVECVKLSLINMNVVFERRW